MFQRYSHVVEPATVAFVTGHDASYNFAVQETDQKQVRPDPKLAANVFVRIIGGPHEVALPPQRYDCLLVLKLERPNLK